MALNKAASNLKYLKEQDADAMKRVKFGVVGLGWFGEKHLKTLAELPHSEVVAVCSRTAQRAEEMARSYGVKKWYTDWEKLARDPEVEAVSVVTHVPDHAPPVIAAAENGKHVLVEKPIAGTLDEADRMIRAAEKNGVLLMVGHILRFENRYAAAREEIKKGGIGKVVSIYTRRNIPYHFASPHLRYGSPILLDTIHDTDLILWYLGAEPKMVYATYTNVKKSPSPEVTWTLYDFPNGAKSVCESIWLLPANTPYAIDAKMEIVGTDGAIYIDCAESGLLINKNDLVKMPDTIHWPLLHGMMTGALKEEISYFVRCVSDGRKPELAPPEEARRALKVVLAAEESAKTSRPINITE